MATAIGALLSILVLALPARAIEPEARDVGLAWQGCWEAETAADDDAQKPLEERQLVCLAPGEDLRSLSLTALVGDRVIRQHTLFTDGVRRPASEGGCSGWRRAHLSEDGRRLYLRAESTCEGGARSDQSGASLMVSGDHWVDIHLLHVDGEREIVIRHYRPLVPGIVSLPGGLPSARHSARLLAAAPLTSDDVIEALQFVDSPVVEVMLLEAEAAFPMDSGLLSRLADAGVPGEIVDLMVALSFPEHFEIRDDAPRPRPVSYTSYSTPWYTPYGYGFGHYYPYPPVTDPPSASSGLKVISGHGYTRVAPTRPLPGGFSGFTSGASNTGGAGSGGASGSGAGSSTSATSSGYQGSGSSSRRTAVPR